MTARRPPVHRTRALRCALLCAAAAALASAGSASAHALLIRAEPADGMPLSKAPSEIRLWFSEAVSSRFRSAELLRPDGGQVAGVRVQSGASSNSVTVKLPQLQRGTYALVWRVLAEDDGHTTSGTLAFGIGTAAHPTGPAVDTPLPAASDVVLRWVRFALVAQLLGGLAFVAVLARARAQVRPELAALVRRRVLVATAGAGAVALAAQLVGLGLQASSLAEAGSGSLPATAWDIVYGTRWGTLWLAQSGLLLLLTLVAFRLLRRGIEHVPASAIVLGASLATAEALSSHASALAEARLPMAVDTVHLLGAAVWIGTISALAIAVWPARGATRREALTLAIAIRRPLAAVASVSAFAVAVSGLYSAGREVASVDALLTTFYGRTLIAKSGVVVVALALGAVNFFLLRLIARGRLRRFPWQAIVAEAFAGALVLLAAGVLTASAPARGAQFAPPRPVVSQTIARQVGDLVVTATVRPNRPGTNVVELVAVSTQRPAPGPIESVRLDLGKGTTPLPLHRLRGRGWFATVSLDRSGTTRATLLIGRSSRELVAPLRWNVEPADPARPVVYSDRSIASIVDPAALVILICGALAALMPALIWLRSQHRTAEALTQEPA